MQAKRIIITFNFELLNFKFLESQDVGLMHYQYTGRVVLLQCEELDECKYYFINSRCDVELLLDHLYRILACLAGHLDKDSIECEQVLPSDTCSFELN